MYFYAVIENFYAITAYFVELWPEMMYTQQYGI